MTKCKEHVRCTCFECAPSSESRLGVQRICQFDTAHLLPAGVAWRNLPAMQPEPIALRAVAVGDHWAVILAAVQPRRPLLPRHLRMSTFC